MMCRSLLLGAALLGVSLCGQVERLTDQYAVCAHVSRGELAIAADEFKVMKQAGIRWARTDFDWNGIERKKGEWHFNHLDKLMGIAEEHDINILPILVYHVEWAKPAWKHLDAWGEYVRQVVTRYGKKLRYWEVFNEPNLQGFWADEVSGENYTKMLKHTYEIIKSIDPDIQVLYGGVAGVPHKFIEDTFKAGAGAYFDIMNIHPYQWTSIPESMLPDFKRLQETMDKYGIANKPIWITEVGWSTAKPVTGYLGAYKAAFEYLGIKEGQYPLAELDDPFLGNCSQTNHASFRADHFTNRIAIGFDQLKDLDPAKYPVLLASSNETFAEDGIEPLKAYLNKGGVALFTRGLPFYYNIAKDEQGEKVRQYVGEAKLAQLHMAWDAWWTKKGLPEWETWQRPADEFKDKFEFKLLRGHAHGRFMVDRNLKGNDKLIPVIIGGDDTYQGNLMAIYKFDSDLKGAIIVCTTMRANECVPEDVQAAHLPRTYLLAFASGLKRVFWYNFRASESNPTEREDNFGIVHRDLSAKPSFIAYQTLSKLCPSGSTQPTMTRGKGVTLVNWTRPDGVKVWALWSERDKVQATIAWEGNLDNAVNYLGSPQELKPGKLIVTTRCIYLVGPTSVDLKY